MASFQIPFPKIITNMTPDSRLALREFMIGYAEASVEENMKVHASFVGLIHLITSNTLPYLPMSPAGMPLGSQHVQPSFKRVMKRRITWLNKNINLPMTQEKYRVYAEDSKDGRVYGMEAIDNGFSFHKINGTCHRAAENGPAIEFIDTAGGPIVFRAYMKDGLYHRPCEQGPAVYRWDETGQRRSESHMENGMNHNLHGCATKTWSSPFNAPSKIPQQQYFINGTHYPSEAMYKQAVAEIQKEALVVGPSIP